MSLKTAERTKTCVDGLLTWLKSIFYNFLLSKIQDLFDGMNRCSIL